MRNVRIAPLIGFVLSAGFFLAQPSALADAPAVDYYPWINTFYYNNLKNPHSFTTADAHFVADHFDESSAHLWYVNDRIREWNSHMKIFQFVGPWALSAWDQYMFEQYLTLHPEYTERETEDVYLHYQCNVTLNGVLYPGCNLTDPETGQCSGASAAGCAASTATQLSQSRVPDPNYQYQMDGWMLADYTSQVWKDYGVWTIQQSDALFGSTYHPEGVWWDNILYLGSHEIDKTIEYRGQPDDDTDHQRNLDYHAYFDYVKAGVEQGLGRSLLWLGNVNNMWWIRSDGPYAAWVLQNFRFASPESWVSPIDFGEYAMPAWGIDCPSMKDAWDYTVNHDLQLPVLTYNNPGGGAYTNPDQRTKAFSIAKYYLVSNPNLFYGYKQDDVGNNLELSQWNRMAEINIGAPRINPAGVRDFLGATGTNRFFDWNNPGTQLNCTYFTWENAVFARHFDNGLVIARWKGQRWQTGVPPAGDPAYNSYIDPRVYGLANDYQTRYVPIQPDGTIPYEPVTSVTLKTNEVAVLLDACDAGVATGTCGCNGVVLDPGELCVPNTLPHLEKPLTQEVNEGETQQFTVHAADAECPDGSCLSFSVTGMSIDSFLTVTNHGDGSATVTLTPDFDDSGSHPFTLHVSDTGQPPGTDSQPFLVTVVDTAHPPEIAAVGDLTIHEGDSLMLTILATDPKPDDHVTLTAAGLPDGASFVDHGDRTGTFSWTPTVTQAGQFPNIQITAADEDESTDTEIFLITVLDGLLNCIPNWSCSEWSVCTDGIHARLCVDNNHCGSDAGRPEQTEFCDSVPPAAIRDLSSE